ncbi:MAG: UDP-N-acetylglucosamine--N-acetylmuramyl-(pentapeptide) pyrophosphoryl-undecaprenol N-acetylglucosamine transferase, partial [Clostridiales bacterium]|nr:UDP-N-acetylglucosamine--N-acetylmuramyl-(pentapeptide) pyrophosphoryl-undecaprenol N-acetylglucosamine transferase [Clostridiales bacterium]
PELDIREYIYDMPVVMDSADVIMSRAGASTIAEISAIAHPSILVPSPNVAANHQEKNARVLSDQDAAVLMLEKDCSGDALYDQVNRMLSDVEGLRQMGRNLRKISVTDANERIYNVLKGLLK